MSKDFPMKVIKLKQFRPSRRGEPARAWLVACAIRFLLLFDVFVVVVGRCRTGKTYLMERAFGRAIFDGAATSRLGKGPTPLDAAALPRTCALDEAACVDPVDLRRALPALRQKRIAVTLQDLSDVQALGLEALLKGRRSVVLSLER